MPALQGISKVACAAFDNLSLALVVGVFVKTNPVGEAQQQHVVTITVSRYLAGWIEQLLKHLVVRCKGKAGSETEFFHPELERCLDWLRREGRSDDDGPFLF